MGEAFIYSALDQVRRRRRQPPDGVGTDLDPMDTQLRRDRLHRLSHPARAIDRISGDFIFEDLLDLFPDRGVFCRCAAAARPAHTCWVNALAGKSA